ncbi:MAG TPA: hypothetical protein PK306_22530 [Aquabacterium sp.]|nr:hypothetical protein [Aquabacterium sp.]
MAGPPGSGKSRLARWAVQRFGEGAHTRWVAARQAHHDAPYGPLAEALRSEIGLQPVAAAAGRMVAALCLLSASLGAPTGAGAAALQWIGSGPNSNFSARNAVTRLTNWWPQSGFPTSTCCLPTATA